MRYPGKIGQKLVYKDDEVTFEYQVHELEGIPEGGNNVFRITFVMDGSEYAAESPNGWEITIKKDGVELDDSKYHESMEYVNAIWYDYALKISNEEVAQDYMGLESNWTMEGGNLVQEED